MALIEGMDWESLEQIPADVAARRWGFKDHADYLANSLSLAKLQSMTPDERQSWFDTHRKGRKTAR